MKWFDNTALTLVIIGAVNWLLIGVFRFDLVAFICGSENLHRLRFRKMSFDTFGDLFHSCIKQFVHFFVKKRFVRSAHDNGNIRFSCGVFFI